VLSVLIIKHLFAIAMQATSVRVMPDNRNVMNSVSLDDIYTQRTLILEISCFCQQHQGVKYEFRNKTTYLYNCII
jgi:hypothetical protein